MKIVVAQDALHAAGGVESYLAAVIPALRAMGHSVALLYVNRRDSTPPIEGVDGPVVGLERGGAGAMFGELRSWGADVCFSNNMEPLDLERRALAEWPVVKLMHGYSGTCISALKTHGFPRRVACGRTLGPACLALYVPRHCGPLRPASLVSGYRWAVAQRALFTEYSAVIVASAHMEDELLRHGVSRERLAVIPMFPTIAPGTEPAGGRDVVLFLGRMTDLKGGDVLIRAMARASRAMRRLIPLLMAGDGPQRAAWERLAAREQVAAGFPGWLADEARSAALARAAVLAVPSIWPEPFGLVGLEAAARGVPSVAFDVGGISTWLRHGVSGLLVDPSAGEIGLASAIEKILEDHALRERLGGGALAVAREMSLDAHMRQLEMVLQRAARGLSSGAGQP